MQTDLDKLLFGLLKEEDHQEEDVDGKVPSEMIPGVYYSKESRNINEQLLKYMKTNERIK